MSPWEVACRERIAAAASWDMSVRANRNELRRWRVRLWWARFGAYACGVIGALIGFGVTQLVLGVIS